MNDLPEKLRRIAAGALEFPDDEAVVRCAADEIERLRAIFVEAHNFWRHDFASEVEVAADRIFKKLSVNNTDPFADRKAAQARRADGDSARK